MVDVVLQRPQEIKALLHAGADPTRTVQLPNGVQSAHSLAIKLMNHLATGLEQSALILWIW